MKKEQQVYIAIGIVVVALVFVFFNFFLKPVNKNIAEKRKKIEELTNTVDTAKTEAGQIDILKAKVSILEKQVKELQERLPKDKDIADLIRRVTKDAQKFGIKVRSLQPRAVRDKGEYNEIPFGIQFYGTFHTLGSFLAEIGQEKRLLSSKDLKLSQDLTKNRTKTVIGNFTLIAFTSK